MFKIRLLRYFSLLISFSLLIAPLPLSAMAQNLTDRLLETEITDHTNVSYVCLDKNLSNIAHVVSEISNLDDNNESLLKAFNEHVTHGFLYAEYDSVIEVLSSAETVLQKNYQKVDHAHAEQLAANLDSLINQVLDGSLTIDSDFPIYRRLRTLIVDENMDVLGQTTLHKHVRTKEGITVSGHLKVGKSALFKGDVTVSGDAILDGNVTITHCINEVCVNNITAINERVDNLSVTNEIAQNISVTTISATDAVIENLTLTGALVFSDLSVVDITVTGTLSANDAVIDNATITNLSVTDCIANLCVDNLSVNDEVIQTFLRFLDPGINYVGFQAPVTVPSSYTLTLPAIPPTANQVLSANAITPTNLEWVAQSGGGSSVPPAVSRIIYVTTYGNDITGDGSYTAPYATLAKAISLANTLSSSTDPITIAMNPGMYVENNNIGPLTVTADGISIVGNSSNGVIIVPSTSSNNLLLSNNPLQIINITFQSSTPLATGITLSAPNVSILENVYVYNFLVGIECAGDVTSSYGFNNCLFIANGTALNVNNVHAECNNSTFFGSSSLVGPAANIGIAVNGSGANIVVSGGVVGVCTTGLNITNNAVATLSSVSFRINAFDVVQAGASQLTISACTFELTNSSSDIDVQISGAGTVANIIGCEFNGKNVGGVPQATGILVSDNAVINISGGTLYNYTTGVQVGLSTDTSSTGFFASAFVIRDCATDILQEGSTTLNLNASTSSSSKININDAANVILAFFDLDTNDALTIGSTTNQDTTLIQAAITTVNNPEINYYSSLYSTQAIGFDNSLLSGPSTWFMLSNGNADLAAITTDRTQVAGLQLYSDEGSPVGGTSALRGWNVQKNGSAAALSFNYQNSDIVGQIAVPQYTVMQLDGLNNQLQLPTAGTHIVFDGDTNLYRSGANVLKTDDNFIVGTLTPGRVVITDPVTNQLESSITTSTELGYLSGVTSSIQTQLNGKVNRSGDTMTGPLSATDIVVTNLTATNFSSTDAIIQNATIVNFSLNDAVVQNSTITNLSSTDAIIQNATITNFSSNDAVVQTLTVNSCISNVCVNNLSVVNESVSGTLSINDAIIQNSTITNLSSTDAILQNATIPNFSSTDGIIQNATITNFSSNDAVVQSLTVNGCISNVCVNNLSVVNESVSGMLSVNDAIIQNSTITNFSSTDAILQNATIPHFSSTDAIVQNATITNFSSNDAVVQNLTVNNCVSSLCVNSLSVVNESVSGTLSVNDVIVQNSTITNFSSTDAIIQNATIPNFSSTDGIIQNATITNFSSNDAVLQNLTVNNCISNVCVNNLSVVNESVSGTLSVNNEIIQNALHFNNSGGNFVGIQAPTTITANYTVSLPSAAPTANQVLHANATTPTNLEWFTTGGSEVPAANKTIYVAKYGNDTTGNGSFDAPYLTLSKAISVANGIATISNPIAIMISSGIYVENNSAGPLPVTTSGISIVGASTNSVIISPSTPANDLLSINNTVRISSITFKSSTPLATAISLSAGTLSVLVNVQVINFLIGVMCAGGTSAAYGFNDCLFIGNGTALSVDDAFAECNNCTFFGALSILGSPANTGINATGSSARLVISGGTCGICETGMNISNNATVTISSVSFRSDVFDIVQSGPSTMILSGSTFEVTSTSSDIAIQVSGAGAIAEIIGCEFNGNSVGGVSEGTGIVVSNNATAYMSGGTVHNYDTALQIGLSSDTSSTELFASGVGIHNCITDIVQEGSATLNFNAGTATSANISVNDPTNVTLAFFDLGIGDALAIGSTIDQDTTLLQAAITTTNNPEIKYYSSLYSTQAIGFDNSLLSNPSTWFMLSNANANLAAITTDRTHVAGLQLYSDEGSPIGGTSALRGWNIEKNGSAAALSFNYQNSDIVGQAAVPQYTVMQLDGFNNLLELPTAGTQIVFDGDTNLYRSGVGVLQTDDNFVVGTLIPGNVVITDAITNQLSSSDITAVELEFLSGTVAAIQVQLNEKVNIAGDTMTGTLQLPAGTTALPSLVFTGSTTSGLSAASGNLSFSTNGAEQMKISSGGIISIDGFTTAGVVHNDASGNLSSSLIVNADITPGTIANSSLATISSLDIAGDIVVRDVSGNFATNMITLDGAVSNPTDAATKAYVDAAISTGLSPKTPAVVVSVTNVALTGLQTIDGVALNTNDRVLLVGQTNPVENGLWLAQSGSWTRPTDFQTGTTAGQAYVLILEGTVSAGSSWLCSTPNAVIDTDPIEFSLFTLPNSTTGANVGVGTGQVFKNKTGVTLNFRTLLQGDIYTLITDTVNEVSIGTNATNVNTPSTIVARDASGNFAAGTVTANLTGSASNNLLLTGGTLTGTLQLPAGTTALPSLVFTGSTTTGLSASSGALSLSTNGAQAMGISSAGAVSINNLAGTAGIVHNSAAGLLTSSLIVNADISSSAAIANSKLATLTAAGLVANSATTATTSSTPNTIVLRDGSGNVTANSFIGNLTGNASLDLPLAGGTMTGTLQLPAGTTALPSLTFTGSTTAGLSATSGNLSFSTNGAEQMKISSGGVISIDAFTSAGILHNDALGNLTSSLIVNADISPTAAIANSKLATLTAAGLVANSATTATSANTASAIVARDASGNFSAGTITANLSGNATTATTATTATNFTGSLAGDVTGTQGATVVSLVGGQTAANVASATVAANAATSANTASTIVARDASGNFSAATITASLNGNATTATSAGSFSGSLVGDVTGTQGATVVSLVGGQTAANVAAATVLANAATNLNTASTIVKRDASGNFAAGTITASLSGNATTATTATNFSGSLVGDVTGTQGATVVSLVGGQTAANVAAATVLANAATNLNTASTIVKRDASGNFAAGTITASLTGHASLDLPLTGGTLTGTLTVPAGTAAIPSIQFTGGTNTGISSATANTLSFDTGGVERMNINSSGVTIDAFTTAGVVHNSAAGLLTSSLIVNADITPATITNASLATISSSNVAGTIVVRDGSGNFAAGTITAALSGNATTATTATNFSGSLVGDVTGTQGATVVSLVGGQTAANVAAATVLANAATSLNTPSTIVERNASGNFSASTIIASLTGAASLNVLKAGDTMTGTLQLPAGTTALPSLVFTGSTISGLSAASGNLSFSTNGAEQMKISSGGIISIDGFTTVGVVHNDSLGNLSSSLIVNADISPTAAIANSKLATLTASGLVANSATTATSANTASAIVARDASGNFSAGTITASLNGNATTATSSGSFSGSLAGDVTGTQGATVVSLVGGQTAANVAAATVLANAATNLNTASTIVKRDASGNFAAGTITASLSGNATTATTATNFSGSLVGDVTGTQGATVVSLVGGQTAANVAAATVLANAATSANTASTIVKRDASGNFAAGTITASLTGHASLDLPLTGGTLTGTLTIPAGTAAAPSFQFTGGTNTGISSATANTLSFDTSGVERMNINSSGVTIDAFTTAGVVHNSAAGLLTSSLIVNADITPATITNASLATISSSNVAGDIVVRDGSGNFAAGTITANLTGNITGNVSGSAASFTGSLVGDVTGTQGATVVSLVGGQTAANVAAATVLANAATNLNTASTIVKRDASGNFAAGTITAALSGNATTATTATNFSGSLVGDVTGTQGATVVSLVGGQTAANVAAATVLANAATSANTASTIVKRDASGNFAAGTITANLIGTVTGHASLDLPLTGGTLTGTLTVPAGTALAPSFQFTGGTNTGISSATANILSFDTSGVEQMNISSSGVTIDAFTTAGVVHNSAAGLLTSSLIVNADITPATITNASLATISSSNVAGDIVVRDGSGNFAAGTITASVTGHASLDLPLTGGTLTGTLTLPAGTAAAPSIQFTSSTNTGLSAPTANALALSTNGAQRVGISSVGAVTVNNLGTGVVHSSSAGLLTSSLIVNADITAGTIANTALATISSSNIAGDIVVRDGSGNFAAGTITAALNGNATTATTTANFSGSLAGDVTGTQGATVVSLVGGQTAANVAAATVLANAATNLDTNSTIVKRDSAGNFAASIVSVTDVVVSRNLVISTDPSTSSAGNILKGANTFIINPGTNNIFVGENSGSLTTSGTGQNSGFGVNALGSVTTSSNNTAVGANALATTASGSQNVAVGSGAMQSQTSGQNVAVGYLAMNANTTGVENTAVGWSAMATNTIGEFNTAIGWSALTANTTGSSNIALGNNSLLNNTIGSFNSAMGAASLAANTTGVQNTALGWHSMTSNVIGSNNTAVGFSTLVNNTVDGNTAVGASSLAVNTTGTGNTAVGLSSLAANTTGINNTAIGANALDANVVGTTNTAVGFNALTNSTVSGNTAVGSSSLAVNTTGTSNTAIGLSSLAANTIGTSNTAVGSTVLAANTTGINNTAVGANALNNNVVGTTNTAVGFNALTSSTVSGNTAVGSSSLAATTTGINNTAVGLNSLTVNTTGFDNTAIGSGALAANTIGAANTALGNSALAANTTGGNNVAIGNDALGANTIGTDNIAIGNSALTTNTTSGNNVAIGVFALTANTAANNTAVGTSSLAANTIGTGNTAIGSSSLAANTTGIDNTAIGANALDANVVGTTNTAIGFNALTNSTVSGNTAVGSSSLAANTTGTGNTALGSSSLAANTIGTSNTAVGSSALVANTTGTNNTAIGGGALSGAPATASNNTAMGTNALSSASGSNNIGIGANVGTSANVVSNNILIGAANPVVSQSNTIVIGTAGTQTGCIIAGIFGVNISGSSPVSVSIGNGGQLGTVTSSIRFKHDIQDMNDASKSIFNLRPVTFVYNEDETNAKQFGLIAEEVNEVLPEIVVNDTDGLPFTVRYEVLPVLLLNEIKKQQNIINSLEDQVAELTINNQTMYEAISNLQQQIKEFTERIKYVEDRA